MHFLEVRFQVESAYTHTRGHTATTAVSAKQLLYKLLDNNADFTHKQGGVREMHGNDEPHI